MSIPSLLIVTNHQSLFAYLIEPEGIPLITERVDFKCDGQTSVSLTSCHPEWKEKQEARAIAQIIDDILDRYHPESWGLACPESLIKELTDELRYSHQKKLNAQLTMEVDDVHVGNVMHLFSQKETHHYQAIGH